MGDIWQGFVEAIKLIFSFDPYVMKITLFTLYVCAIATSVGMLIGIPLGSLLALYRFRGRKFMVTLVNAGMGLPPVVVGLFVYMFLKRRGPLGFLGWLYTPTAIIIAEIVLAMPLIAGITMAAMQNVDPRLRLQSKSLGASEVRSTMTLLRETRLSLLAAVIAGFGGIISEVGAAMIVGGNLLVNNEPYTRTLTTATVQEIGQGNSTTAIALGIILLGITFLLVWILTSIQQGSLLSEPARVARSLFNRFRREPA
ncbi:MAG: ABC transporter permease subunit [Actinobacteria bacterium]|jgi:tungstate transport system permease protein|nr:MAG: ABC transporter permease subunit [Actinomycetota bacterium]